MLTPADAVSLDDLAARILAFQTRYEDLVTPFEWKFTRADLKRLLRDLASKEPDTLAAAA